MSMPQFHEGRRPDIAHIAGLILAGGKSSRFGAEKAVAMLHGELLMDGAVRAFSVLPAFAVSARAESGAERRAKELGATVLHDNPSYPNGPLAGLAAGFAWAKRNGFAFVASAPCDAPLLPNDLVQRLADAIGAASAAYAITDSAKHPLCALWRVELLASLEEQLHTGHHPAVRTYLQEIQAIAVPFSTAAAFANANTADTLAALEAGS